jgi:GNAT superfamily N-acetyltransferase
MVDRVDIRIVHINSFGALSLWVDNGRRDIITQWAHLYMKCFQQPPWTDTQTESEYISGIWRDMAREGAMARLIFNTDSNGLIGVMLGHAVSANDVQRIAGHTQGSNAFLEFFEGVSQKEWFLVEATCVEEESRGQGIGDTAFQSLVDGAHETYLFRGIILRTHPAAVPAVRLYGRHGFVRIDETDAGIPDRIWMVRRFE